MQYRKSSVADIRLREEEDRRECTFQPRIIENPFVSEKTLRKYGEATPASAMLRRSKRATSPSERRSGPGLLAGMYTATGGLKRGPPEKPGIPMFYFDPFSPPNFATGTYGAPQIITQIIQTVSVPPPTAPVPPPAAVAPPPLKSGLKAPPLPPWLGKPVGGKSATASAPPKIVIQRKEKVEAAPEPSGWQAVLLEMQKRANKRNGGDAGGDAKEKEKKMEKPKPQPKPKRTLGKKKEFKDPVEELKYKFALKRGEIQEDDGDGEDDGEAEQSSEKSPVEDAKPAAKKPDIAAMLAKAKLGGTTPIPPAATPAIPAAGESKPSAAGGGGSGIKAVPNGGKKVPMPPPLPPTWPPVPCKEAVKAPASTASAAAATTTTTAAADGAGGKKSFAGAAAALMAALANRGKGGSSSEAPAEPSPSTAVPPAPVATATASVSSAAASAAPAAGETTVVTLKPGEVVPEGAQARTVTVPGTKVLPDGYYLAANSPNINVAPYEILAAGETTVSLILQVTAQMDPEQTFKNLGQDKSSPDEDILIDQLGSRPGDQQIAKLSRRLTASDLPVPAGYVQAVSRMQRNVQQRQHKLQQQQQLELRNYESSDGYSDHVGTPDRSLQASVKNLLGSSGTSHNLTLDLSYMSSSSGNSNTKALQTSQRLHNQHTKAFQQYATITSSHHQLNINRGSEEHKGFDFGATRWFNSLRSSSTLTSSSANTPTNKGGFQGGISQQSSGLHLSHLHQTQQHLLNQAQNNFTQPKEPNFLSDAVVARRQHERLLQQEQEQYHHQQRLQERKQRRQEQSAKLRQNLSLRYETLQIKARKYQQMLQSHKKQLPPSVRQDVQQKLQVLLQEMETVAQTMTQQNVSTNSSVNDLAPLDFSVDSRAIPPSLAPPAVSTTTSYPISRPHSHQSLSSLGTTPSHVASSALHKVRMAQQAPPPSRSIDGQVFHKMEADLPPSAPMPTSYDSYYYADFPMLPPTLSSPYPSQLPGGFSQYESYDEYDPNSSYPEQCFLSQPLQNSAMYGEEEDLFDDYS
jgi:hypothetical protein